MSNTSFALGQAKDFYGNEQFGISKVQAVAPNDFPQLARSYNGKRVVYLDNSATTLKPQRVIDAINIYNGQLSSNVHRGAHMLADATTSLFEGTRKKVARFLNAKSEHEIVFTSGTTDSINLVARCFGGVHLQEGDEVIVSEMEHHANIVPWQFLESSNKIKLLPIPILENGSLDMEAFHRLLSPRTKLVAITHTSNALGVINPIEEIIEAAHGVGAKVLIDGAQAVAHTRVDVQKLDADFFVFSGHKLFGPTGIGVLYGKYNLLDTMSPYKGGGEMIVSVKFSGTSYKPPPNRFEAGTPPVAEVIGLGEAIDFVEEIGFSAIQKSENHLLALANPKLKAIKGLHMFGDVEKKVPLFSFLLEGLHVHDIGFFLNQEGVAIRTGRHCAEPIMDRYGISGTARASFAFYNTEEDVEALVEAIEKCIHFFK